MKQYVLAPTGEIPLAHDYVVRDHGRSRHEMPMAGGYYVDYSEPSEKAINSVDPEMKALIARSKVVWPIMAGNGR